MLSSRSRDRRLPSRRVAVALGIVILLVLGVFSASQPSSSPGRTATSADEVAALQRTPKVYGLAYGDELVWMSPKQLAAALDDAVSLGVTGVRLDVSWADVQWDGPNRYNWANLDRVMAAARSRHLTVLPVLAYTPPWARVPGCQLVTCPPRDPKRFAKFAALAAGRYKAQGVHRWEVWNEPNGVGAWMPKPDALGYAVLLKWTVAAIRATDSHAFIVMGGLTDVSTQGGNISPTDFLARLSWLHGNRLVDAVAYHPYTYPYLAGYQPTAWTSPWDVIDRSPDSLAAVLRRTDTPNLPVWVTEYGAPSAGAGAASDGNPAGITDATDHVTEQRQAQIAADVVATTARDPRVGALFWYSQRDRGTSTDTNENFYGLRRANGSQKPAFAALKHAVRKAAR